MALLPVEAALARILAKAWPMDAEEVPLDRLAGRVLATDVCARLSQPPFDASAMDGYAVRAQDVTTRPAHREGCGVDGVQWHRVPTLVRAVA